MSCRSTGAGSCITSYVHFIIGDGLPHPAVLSLYHELIKDNTGREHSQNRTQEYTDNEYRVFLTQLEGNIQHRTAFSVETKQSLLERIERARQEPTPNVATVKAMQRLLSAARNREYAINSYLRDVARRTQTPLHEVTAEFYRIMNETNRSNRVRSRVMTVKNEELAARLRLGRDVGIVNAVAQVEAQTEAVEIARMKASPQRITQKINVPAERMIGFPGLTITSIGYDARVGRLEVETLNNGEPQLLAYTNVPNETWERMNNASHPGEIWAQEIRGVPSYQYANEKAAAADGVAPRCEVCGRFADDVHSCPFVGRPRELNRWNTSSRWSRQEAECRSPYYTHDSDGNPLVAYREGVSVGISMPAVREFREQVNLGPVRVEPYNLRFSFIKSVPSWDNPEVMIDRIASCVLQGSMVVWKEEDELKFDTNNLRCSCPDYQENRSCEHIDTYVKAVRTRLEPTPRAPRTSTGVRRGRMTAEQRAAVLVEAQQRAEAAAVSDWMLSEEGREEASRLWLENTEVSYSRDYAAFMVDFADAQMRVAAKNGEPDIPYKKENVLNGLCKRGSGKAFGMEIEFDIANNVNSQEAIDNIARELYEAGITWSPQRESYGASKGRGFRDTHDDENGVGNWSFERDGSVEGGELVTPGMYDEPETWEKLAKAVEIIKRNGGIPSTRAGAHVHVGTPEYEGNVRAYTELARFVNQHEDVLFRLAADPARGTHRNNGYAKPLPAVPNNGYQDLHEMRNLSWNKYTSVNFKTVSGNSTDHPEFRMFDSTLNVGAMQAQIKLAVAITDAAKRVHDSGGSAREREELGAHVERFKARGTRIPMSDSELEADTRTFRSLLDTLFTRHEDKKQMIDLFASTKWTKKKAGRRRY